MEGERDTDASVAQHDSICSTDSARETHAVSDKCDDSSLQYVAPDGGWGWVVCAACFMSHVLTDGIQYSFGVVFVELLDYFKGSKGETAIIGSISAGICYLSGIGYGMIYLPSIVCVSQYFEGKRALATGIGVSGAGVGTFIFSPLTSILIKAYAWQGALLIQAGLALNCFVCAIVFRPVTTASVKDTSDSKTDNADEHLKVNRINGHSPYKYDYEKYRVDEVSTPTDDTMCSESVNEEDLNDSVSTVPSRYVAAPLLNDTIHSEHEESVKKKTFGDILRIGDIKASFLVSSVGITNTFGRVLFGFLSDRKCVNRLVLYATALVICGAATCVGPFLTSFPSLLVYTILFGTFSGVTISLTSVLLTDIVGIDKLAHGLGGSNFFGGIGSFAGPPIAGWLYDVSGNYLMSYIAAGVAIFLSGAMLYFVPCIENKMKSRKSRV